MVQHSSGVNIEVSDVKKDQWESINEIYLEEAKLYKLRCKISNEVQIIIDKMPLPMIRKNEYLIGNFQTPFNSGKIDFTIIINDMQIVYNQYVYPDSRKITNENYMQMISDILKEAAVCFDYSGLKLSFDTNKRTNECTWAQWNYIENTFESLKKVFNKIEERPIKRLVQENNLVKKEKLKNAKLGTVLWIEKKSKGYNNGSIDIPDIINEYKTQETMDIYENRFIKSQLIYLEKLLRIYSKYNYENMQNKINKYINWINYKLNLSFLNNIKPHFGTNKITQIFRKDPLYKFIYGWFDKLKKFEQYNIGFSHSIPVSNTYQIYEIWCYMQIVKILREEDYIVDTSNIFKIVNNQLFLTLGEHKNSSILLKDNKTIAYQRVFQFNSPKYYSFTQRMIPDIVLENDEEIIVFDPKYRIDSKLGNALAEMHKYRDGIISREENKKVVKEAYILAPSGDNCSEMKDYFSEEYREKYKLGAFCLNISHECEKIKNFIYSKVKSKELLDKII